MKIESREIYNADDGTVFPAEADCRKYEAEVAEKAKRTTYWQVAHDPDLTETGLCSNMLVVECYGPEYAPAEGLAGTVTNEIMAALGGKARP